MKKVYPRYKQGEVIAIEKRLSRGDKEILEEFLKKCSITAGERKVQKIKRLVLQLFDVTGKSLSKQNKSSIDSFLVLLNKCDKSGWTKDEIRIYIKQFILWLYKDPTLVENFKTETKKGLNPQKVTEDKLITEKDIEKMLRYTQNYKEKAYLLVAFQTGARPQELAILKWKDLNFQEDYVNITLFSNKTKRSRTFPVNTTAKKVLWDLKQHYPFQDVSPQDYVFSSRWRDKPMTSDGLNKILRRIAIASGLNKDVWNYLLRHTRATKLYEELPQPIVEKLMGHTDMAKIYAHISDKKAREMMLNKIYKIDKLEENQKELLQKKVKGLEENLKMFLTLLVSKKITEGEKKFIKEKLAEM